MKRTTLFIQDELEREVQALARRNGRSVAAVVRDAIAEYVIAARREAPPRPRFIAAGRSGHRDVAERHEDLLFETVDAARSEGTPASTRTPPRGASRRRRSPGQA